MALHFKIEHDARIEILGHFHRIAEQSPHRAAKWYHGLLAKIETLEKLPLRCPVASESESTIRPVRELLYGKKKQAVYRILFEIDDGLIRVLSVRHRAQGFYPL